MFGSHTSQRRCAPFLFVPLISFPSAAPAFLYPNCSAAANPCEGHYNRAKSVAENLKMSAPMLSRFDLIFILLDRPDEAMDARLSEHVMALHSGVTGRAQAARQRLLAHTPSSAAHNPLSSSFCSALPPASGLCPSLGAGCSSAGGTQAYGGTQQGACAATQQQPARPTLAERLRRGSGSGGCGGAAAADNAADLLPTPLLRKYLAYARQYVHPVMSDGAKEVLQVCCVFASSQGYLKVPNLSAVAKGGCVLFVAPRCRASTCRCASRRCRDAPRPSPRARWAHAARPCPRLQAPHLPAPDPLFAHRADALCVSACVNSSRAWFAWRRRARGWTCGWR